MNYSKKKRIKFGGLNKNFLKQEEKEKDGEQSQREKGKKFSNLSDLDPSIINNFKKINAGFEEKTKKLRSSSVCYSSNNDHNNKNNYEGRGIYYYNDGSRYEGDFKKGKRDGKGIYYYFTGNTYEGDWKDDKREGKGVYYYSNGDREMGNYLDNKEIGIHAVLKANGKVTYNNYNS